jgi:ATP synthase protein I
MKMNNQPDDTSHRDTFARQVGEKAKRKLRARASGSRGVWFGLGMMGLVGWSVSIPMLAGTALGLWIDGRHPGGHSWTLMLLVSGLCIGCLNAGYWIAEQNRHMEDELEDRDE